MSENIQEIVPEEELKKESEIDDLKESVISRINSSDYDLELKKSLLITAQEHFDSDSVI